MKEIIMQQGETYRLKTKAGVIEIRPYDDGCAEGVHVCFDNDICAAIDCYKTVGACLPTTLLLDSDVIDGDGKDYDEAVCDYLSETYGFCIYSFKYELEPNGELKIWDIEWDTDAQEDERPEARLLVYGPYDDEPRNCITLN